MKQRLSVAFAACVLVLWSVFALAQMPQPFSADMSTTSANGNVNMKAKVFISVPKMRFDMSETDQRQNSLFGHKMNMIVDGDSNMAYILMPDAQMYMEFLADAKNPMLQRMPNVQDFKNDPCAGRQDVLCKKVGTETVNGRSCDKWESTDKTGNKETLWIDQKLHFPIKSQTGGGMTTEFTNIKEGAQDPALFKVPSRISQVRRLCHGWAASALRHQCSKSGSGLRSQGKPKAHLAAQDLYHAPDHCISYGIDQWNPPEMERNVAKGKARRKAYQRKRFNNRTS